jgi:hypothetical protein
VSSRGTIVIVDAPVWAAAAAGHASASRATATKRADARNTGGNTAHMIVPRVDGARRYALRRDHDGKDLVDHDRDVLSTSDPARSRDRGIRHLATTAPRSLTATAGNTSVRLSWSASSSNGGSPITGYNVYRSTSPGGEGSTPLNANVTGTSYTDPTVTNGTTYYSNGVGGKRRSVTHTTSCSRGR